jgi:hypothetical protein
LNIKPAQESDENKKEIFGRNQICLKWVILNGLEFPMSKIFFLSMIANSYRKPSNLYIW